MPAKIARLIPDHAAPRSARILTGENGRVWQLYVVENWTQQEIADELGISRARVSKILAAVRESLPEIDRQEIVRERVIQLRAVANALVPRVLSGDPQSVRAFLKVLDREARYLGLDAPTTIAAAIETAPLARYILEMDADVRKALE